MRKMYQRVFDKICKRRIEAALPGISLELAEYSKHTKTTGTQWITLWYTVSGILKHKPKWILECGTGSSTLVLAAAVQKLKAENPSYEGHIVSMESVEAWYELADSLLPEKYRDTVDIVLGPREKFEMGFFRGYIHSNIPVHDYGFILIDGPSYYDENGLSFCADLFKVMDISNEPVIHGVSDGRASSVFVIQTLYGHKAARYYHRNFAARFSVPKINFRDAGHNTPKDFGCTIGGRLFHRRFRR